MLVPFGFDARVELGVLNPQWTPERRALFLLRPDVAEPLSIDDSVWPRVPAARSSDASDYWRDLAALRRACAAEPATLIALAVWNDCDASQAFFETEPGASIDAAWRQLGWDIADAAFTSGLSNCGYEPPHDVADLRARVGAQLNEHGLFDDLPLAQAFRRETEQRVPEHAPFLLFCLFEIPSR